MWPALDIHVWPALAIEVFVEHEAGLVGSAVSNSAVEDKVQHFDLLRVGPHAGGLLTSVAQELLDLGGKVMAFSLFSLLTFFLLFTTPNVNYVASNKTLFHGSVNFCDLKNNESNSCRQDIKVVLGRKIH